MSIYGVVMTIIYAVSTRSKSYLGLFYLHNRTKMSVPNEEKESKRFIIWTKIAHHDICIVNTDNEQQRIEDSDKLVLLTH